MPFLGVPASGAPALCAIALGQWLSHVSYQCSGIVSKCRSGGKQITVHLLNGAKVSGNVRSFDKYSIVLENNTQAQLIFKHSVSALLVCCKNKRCTETRQSGSPGIKSAD